MILTLPEVFEGFIKDVTVVVEGVGDTSKREIVSLEVVTLDVVTSLFGKRIVWDAPLETVTVGKLAPVIKSKQSNAKNSWIIWIAILLS